LLIGRAPQYVHLVSYYNTTHEKGDRLKFYLQHAEGQEVAILALFRDAQRPLAPSELFHMLDGRYPITSIRRAMTTMTHKRALVKTVMKSMGMYGRYEHLWRLYP